MNTYLIIFILISAAYLVLGAGEVFLYIWIKAKLGKKISTKYSLLNVFLWPIGLIGIAIEGFNGTIKLFSDSLIEDKKPELTKDNNLFTQIAKAEAEAKMITKTGQGQSSVNMINNHKKYKCKMNVILNEDERNLIYGMRIEITEPKSLELIRRDTLYHIQENPVDFNIDLILTDSIALRKYSIPISRIYLHGINQITNKEMVDVYFIKKQNKFEVYRFDSDNIILRYSQEPYGQWGEIHFKLIMYFPCVQSDGLTTLKE